MLGPAGADQRRFLFAGLVFLFFQAEQARIVACIPAIAGGGVGVQGDGELPVNGGVYRL